MVGRYIETNTLRIQDPKSGIVAVGNEPLRLHADMALSKAQGLKVGSLAISNKYGTANAPTNGLYVKGDAEVRGGVGVRTVASSAVGVNAEGILAGVQGKGLTSGVRGVSDSGVGVFADTAAANNAAVYAKNTGDGPAIEVSQGWIKLPSDSIAIGGAGDIVYMKAVPVGKIRNGSDNRWLTVVNSYVKDGSIILATIQDAYSFGQTTNVRAIKNGRFELYIPKQRTVAFLILNQ